MSLLFKKYSLVEVLHLLIRFNKKWFFLWNTKNTEKDTNGQNVQKTHTTQAEKDNFRNG